MEPKATSKKRYIRAALLFLVMSMFVSSCYKERYYPPPPPPDPIPGNACLALDYYDLPPDYLDVGTSSIPPVFEWNRYYLTAPGYYTMYYEGEYWDGYMWQFYAWELDYEIWRDYGEPATRYSPGRDGLNNYFTIDIGPDGPYLYENSSYYKSGAKKLKEGTELVEESTDKIVVLKKHDGINLKITYKRVGSKK